MRKALALLAEAGWKLNGQRLQNAAGQPLRLEILLVNPNLERILQPYAENLASIGIDAHLRTVDRGAAQVSYDQQAQAVQTDVLGPRSFQRTDRFPLAALMISLGIMKGEMRSGPRSNSTECCSSISSSPPMPLPTSTP